MKQLYMVIYRSTNQDLLYAPVDKSVIAMFFTVEGLYISWNLTHEDYLITVFTAVFSAVPIGENREEIEHRVLAAFDLS